MAPERPFLFSQKATNEPYPVPVESNSQLQVLYL